MDPTADPASSATPSSAVVLGLVLVAFGGWQLISARRIRARGVRVPGVVIGYKQVAGGGEEPLSRPVFRFTTLEGHELEVTSRTGEPRGYLPDERIEVLYNPQKPERARIDNAGQRGSTMGWIVTTMGVFVLAVGVLGFLDVNY
ncbi:DUF3592 domain-containing protein [Nonomuraea terrae]|uniref:DUF3592 domain-containing protein n=1 Tax=Nonomuraea terrae TaxID=2530383 RepID=UPI0014043B4A|nr:DUF3592 domain-containing protein [Nonomuraea terrae]